jgi:hypothetical protein
MNELATEKSENSNPPENARICIVTQLAGSSENARLLCAPPYVARVVVACPFGVSKFGKGFGEPADGTLRRDTQVHTTHAQGGIPA